jgi:hypothetical protein
LVVAGDVRKHISVEHYRGHSKHSSRNARAIDIGHELIHILVGDSSGEHRKIMDRKNPLPGNQLIDSFGREEIVGAPKSPCLCATMLGPYSS